MAASPQASHGQVDIRDDDDEETLQLKLKAIEARLRLKKLQRQSNSEKVTTVDVPVSPKRRSAPNPLPSQPSQVPQHSDQQPPRKPFTERLAPRNAPIAKAVKPTVQRSSFNNRLADARAKDESAGERRRATQRKQSKGFALKQGSPDSRPLNDSCGSADLSDKDKLSGIHLSRRFIASDDLNDILQDKDLYKLPRLLKEVTSPSYSPPETDGDYVVFGIIASKSDPILHSKGATSVTDTSKDNQAKFMVLHLTDLEWEIDLYLFGSGFDSFWKLSVGSVLAILNPGIMPPKRHMRDSGQFSLKLSSSDDAVLEIGSAAHLGFCKSVKKDGSPCGSWFDARKADHCDFHTSLAIERSRSSRMETNTMSSFGAFAEPRGRVGRSTNNARARTTLGNHGKDGQSNDRRGQTHRRANKNSGFYRDYDAHSNAFMVPPELQAGASAAQLLDSQDLIHFNGSSANERRQKRLARLEQDRKLASALSKDIAHSLRHEPDKQMPAGPQASQSTNEVERLDARSLGLVGQAGPRLSTSRRGAANAAAGWSSAFKRGLPENTQHGPSPKKARFDLAGKGVREPGRESREDLKRRPQRAAAAAAEDDLEIV